MLPFLSIYYYTHLFSVAQTVRIRKAPTIIQFGHSVFNLRKQNYVQNYYKKKYVDILFLVKPAVRTQF